MIRKFYNISLYTFAIIGFVLITGFIVSKSGLTDIVGITDPDTDYYNKSRNLMDSKNLLWLNTPEYISLRESLKNEKIVLERVEKETGVKPRLLASILFVEQMRLYTSNRELFKKVFKPLKLLGVQSQFSWGVLGLKQGTLIQIEENAKIDNYNLLSFSTSTENIASERFLRVTDEHNHYYSYLYAAILLKQLEKQWQNAGYDISNKPEILATLYNIGFIHSKPNADPKVGGADIEIAGTTYSFGKLAYEFYYSDELTDIFIK